MGVLGVILIFSQGWDKFRARKGGRSANVGQLLNFEPIIHHVINLVIDNMH
jgi:hypothetical protein